MKEKILRVHGGLDTNKQYLDKNNTQESNSKANINKADELGKNDEEYNQNPPRIWNEWF